MRLSKRALDVYQKTRTPHVSHYGTSQVPAKRALESARYIADVSTRFENAERAGLVKIESECDEFGWKHYFDGDTFDPEKHPGHPGGARAIIAERKAAERKIESWGLVSVISYFRATPNGPWEVADSISGIEGDADPRGAHGYGPDLMGSALDQLRDALHDAQQERADLRAGRCPTCHK